MSNTFPRIDTGKLPQRFDLVSDYVAYGAENFPEHDFAILEDHVTSYQAAATTINIIAKALIAAGIKKGDRVATMLPPCPDFFLIFLATASIGAIWVGLNPKYSRRELEYPIQDCDPTLLIYRRKIDGRNYEDDIHSVCSGLSKGITPLPLRGQITDDPGMEWQAFLSKGRHIEDNLLTAMLEAVHTEDPCLIIYTSGTTGKPKGAVLTHQGLVYCSLTDARYNIAGDKQRILCNFPINHIACVGDVCMTNLVLGGTLVFMGQFDPRGVLSVIEQQQITHLGQIPVMHQAIFSHPDVKKYDLSSLKTIIWGGNPASIELVRTLRKFAPNLTNVYGMTETTGNILYVRDQGCPDETFANTVGWAPEEYEVVLLSDSGERVKVGEVGEICVRGDFLMQGYWNNPKATAEAFHPDGWMRTGDLAMQREDGAYSITGRRSEMFKSGGYNIYPAEVEQVIEALSGVSSAIVVGVPDPVYSEVGHAFVQCKDRKITLESLKVYCRDLLANYKVPKQFHLVETLPMLPNGKVDKVALKAQAQKDNDARQIP